ncbi:hypothetical protein [Nocardiopsis sp. MG754419]|uniref:hypothetical protein n=1 Tax=Nocardiopsis sp. MG754419 TaxID=2259865 RepID=UPI001BA5466D|nr:hypothetical protein [Nocardiopsis sp. MG754419]MBR8740727.1 hypothetical protein [Nocardiopsis sp. MG754419]
MCEPDMPTDAVFEPYVYDPSLLSRAQCMGDACAVCHTKWPRPRRVLGELPDGAHVYGCDECAGIIGLQPVTAGEPLMAAR